MAAAGIAGDVDEHLDVGVDQRIGVVGHDGLAGRKRFGEILRDLPRNIPAGVLQRLARALRNQIGEPNHVQPARGAGLRQEHGAELAGADQADPDRAAGFGALTQHTGEVHGLLSSCCK